MIDSLYDCFKHWSENGSVYIISDTHFDDEDCRKMDPNWITPEEHIAILNKYAHKNDTLIILGDIGNTKYISKLKAGHKVLICGNHDSGITNYKRRTIYEKYDKSIYSYKQVIEIVREKYPNSEFIISDDYDMIDAPSSYYGVTIDNNLFGEVYEGPIFISEKILLSHERINGLDFCLNIHGHDHNLKERPDKYHINVASNVCNYTPISLKDIIKDGAMSNIKSIHRETIDRAVIRKKNRKVS